MSASSLLYVYEKEDIGQEVDETISALPKSGHNELLTINGDPVCELYGTFGKGMHLSIYLYLCFVEEILPNISEEKVM